MTTRIQIQILILSLVASTTLGAISAVAQEATEREIAILEQPLPDSLKLLADEFGLQLAFFSEVAEGIDAPELNGSYTQDQALDTLLADTSLEYHYMDNGTVVVAAEQEASSGDPESGKSQPASSQVLMAQNQTSAAQIQNSPNDAKTEKDDLAVPLEEIIVTGTNIRGVTDGASQVLVFDKQYIDKSGFSSIEELFTSMPQNFASLGSDAGAIGVPGLVGSNGAIQGSSINLRGLGQGTTLILINGRRVASGITSTAVDISGIPLSAVDRVEVLTDGATAIYGSDAIGGVVNIILKDNYQGAETRLRFGRASGNVNQYRISQTFGGGWGSGNTLLSLEYVDKDPLQYGDRYLPTTLNSSLTPDEQRYSIVFSINQDIGDGLTIFADALHTQRDSFNTRTQTFGATDVLITNDLDNPQTSAAIGLTWDIANDWQVNFVQSHSVNETDFVNVWSAFLGTRNFLNRFTLNSTEVKADGVIFQMPGGDAKLAVGGSYRKEKFDDILTSVPSSQIEQTVDSFFAEVYLPIVGDANAGQLVQRLELTLAGRYDSYSNFGSSSDPKIGLLWEPVNGFIIRGSYGTSYKAPSLWDYSTTGNTTVAANREDPDSPTGFSDVVTTRGKSGNYRPQIADTYSVGFEIAPETLRGFTFRANYYNIEYTDKLEFPPQSDSVVLNDPAAFGSLINRNPTVEEVNAALLWGTDGLGLFDLIPGGVDPNAVGAINHLELANLSSVDTNGFDILVDYAFESAAGDFNLGLNANRILEIETKVTTTSSPFERANTIFNPPELRLRGSFGWRGNNMSANFFVNYTDDYTDNRLIADVPISSYTTADLILSYNSGDSTSWFKDGLKLSLSALNLFDEEPPSVAADPSNSFGYDPANANPMGRLVYFEISKRW